MQILLWILLAVASAGPLEKLAQQVASQSPEQGLLEVTDLPATGRNAGDPCTVDSQCKVGLKCRQEGATKVCRSPCYTAGKVIPSDGKDYSVGCNSWCSCDGTNLLCHAVGCPLVKCATGQVLVWFPPTPDNCCGIPKCVPATGRSNGDPCDTDSQCKVGLKCRQSGTIKVCKDPCDVDGTIIPADGKDHSTGCNEWCSCDGTNLLCHAIGCPIIACPVGTSMVQTPPTPDNCCGNLYCLPPTNRAKGDVCDTTSQCKSGLRCLTQNEGGKKCSACVYRRDGPGGRDDLHDGADFMSGTTIPDDGVEHTVGCNMWCRCDGTDLACRAVGCPLLGCGPGTHLVTTPPTADNCCGVSSCQPVCGINEVYSACGAGCQRKCGDPALIACTRICKPGCVCQTGFVRRVSDNRCIKEMYCPAVSVAAP